MVEGEAAAAPSFLRHRPFRHALRARHLPRKAGEESHALLCAQRVAALVELGESGAPAGVLHYANAGRASWFDLARETFRRAGADPDRVRPYRVPGGRTTTWLVTWVPAALLAAAAVFFIWNPYDSSWAVTGSILIGLAVTVGIQEYFCARAPRWTRDRALERGEDPDAEPELAVVD